MELLLLDVASEESISTAAKEVENKHGRYVNGSVVFLNLFNNELTTFLD